MIFLVCESHGPEGLGGVVNELAQRITGERMIIADGVDVLELAVLVIAPLSVGSAEVEPFNFVGSVKSISVFLVQTVRIAFQDAADVGTVGRTVLVDDVAKNEHLARSEDVGRR